MSVPAGTAISMSATRTPTSVPDDWTIYLCRLIAQRPISEDGGAAASALDCDFKSVNSIERASFKFIERVEGTASHAKFLKDMPEELRIPGP